MMSMSVLGVANTVAKFTALATAATAANEVAELKAGETVEARAKALAPVDTGALLDSITTKHEDGAEFVGTTDIDYARFQEFGFHDQAGNFHIHPFLRPAADGAAPQVLNDTAIILGAAIRAVVGV